MFLGINSDQGDKMKDRLPNKILITLDEALQILKTPHADVLVLEVVSDFYQELALQQYRNSRPGPIFAQIKTERLEVGPLWNLNSDSQLQHVLAEYELEPTTQKQILLYDNIQLVCGKAQSRFDASARLYSILFYFGFSNVAIILDPDVHPTFPDEFSAQHQEMISPRFPGFSSSETSLSQEVPSDQGRWHPKHKEHFVSYKEMDQMVAGELGPYRLLDARSAEEYAGVYTGYEYVALAGRIPTAESVINNEYQVSAKESLASVLSRLAATLEGKGIGHHDRIVWYCGTGWRASRMCALTQALGYLNVAIYDGGWNEWQLHHPEDGREAPWGIDP